MITETEHLASIAYNAFCQSFAKTSENPDHYVDTFFNVLESDIRRAWVAATAAVIEATRENETDA